ncbi:unnamed protein product, partial [Polarella glacialis]
ASCDAGGSCPGKGARMKDGETKGKKYGTRATEQGGTAHKQAGQDGEVVYGDCASLQKDGPVANAGSVGHPDNCK